MPHKSIFHESMESPMHILEPNNFDIPFILNLNQPQKTSSHLKKSSAISNILIEKPGNWFVIAKMRE